MRSIILIIVLTLVVQTPAQEPVASHNADLRDSVDMLTDTLVDRAHASIDKLVGKSLKICSHKALKAMPLCQVDLDSTILGKPNPPATWVAQGHAPARVLQPGARAFASMTSTQLGTSEIPIVDTSGGSVDLKKHAAGKRVALYFTAGWCPMCTMFEPALNKYRLDAEGKGMPVECVMVSSDLSATDASQRAKTLGMVQVAYDGGFREALKRKFRSWSGRESSQLGSERRSGGVPALVVLDENGEEMAFLDAEREGGEVLQKWPESGKWP